MPNKVLTISIAAYNVEKYIGILLDYVSKCKFLEQMEVLVIDDGGTDRTREIAAKYAEKYPQSIYVVHKDNGGWGSTVNYAIKHAQGKYLRLLDGDDYVLPDETDEFIKRLIDNDDDLIITDYVTFDDVKGEDLESLQGCSRHRGEEHVSINDVAIGIAPQMHGMTFKTELLRNRHVRIMEKCFYTDMEYILYPLRWVNTVSVYDMNLYHYRISRDGQSVSDIGFRKHYQEHRMMSTNMIELYQEINQSEVGNSLKELYRRIISRIIEKQYVIYLKMSDSVGIVKNFKEYDDYVEKSVPELYRACAISIKLGRLAEKINVFKWYGKVYRNTIGRKS